MFEFTNILVPVDFSECSEKALGTALALAAGRPCSVHMLHVAPTRGGSATYIDNAKTKERVASIELDEAALADQLRGVAARLAETLDEPPDLDAVGFRVGAGEPAGEILFAAKELRTDLIVMGSHGRRGLKDFLVGSTTEQVVKKANCSVLAVKPDGYPFLRD